MASAVLDAMIGRVRKRAILLGEDPDVAEDMAKRELVEQAKRLYELNDGPLVYGSPLDPETCAFCVHRAMATERVSTAEMDPHHRPGTLFAFCQKQNADTPHDFDCHDFERREL